MTRRVSVRAIGWAGAGVAALALAGCNEGSYLPRDSRHWVALSPEIQSKMSEMGLSKHAPILIRAFKKESELEIWKADGAGEYKLLKTFPICRWSGQLGPKKVEGDRQVPEGFYSITPQMMNPNSSFYLSFNVGYPNNFDKQLGRNGSNIMVHGACSSRGCFSMTDQQIADIYALARESFSGGQKSIQMQSFPFRFTPENLAKYRADDNLPFWKNLKEGADRFEVSKRDVQVAACNGKYRFGAGADASAACASPPSDDAVSVAVRAKAQQDEVLVAELAKSGQRALKRIYQDGDQHPSFKRTIYASVGSENVSRAGMVPQGVSRVAEVSRPDALDAGPIDVPAEKARGLNRQQLLALAHRERFAPEPAAPVSRPAAGTMVAATTAPAPQTARSAVPPPAVQATALVAEEKKGEKPAFYESWLGALSGLTASATGATETSGSPAQLPTPPQRR